MNKLKERKENRKKIILIAIISLLFTLFLCEITIRLFFPQKLCFNVSKWDPYCGFSNIPNVSGYSKTKDYKMYVKINSRGLRDREFDHLKPHNTFRIGIFGDSFTFGEGVQNNETYPKVFEHLLRNDERIIKSKVNFEVLNFSIGKTGTNHQLAFYQNEGRKYQLDMVILGFLAGNDFSDNLTGVFYLKNNKLIHNPSAYSSIREIQRIVYRIPFYKWLITHSHLANLLRKSATIYDDKKRTKQGRNLNSQDANDIKLKEYDITLKLVEEFISEVVQNGSHFIFINLPAKNQKILSDFSETDNIPSYVTNCFNLLNALKYYKINILDLVPLFSIPSKELYYFKNDGHMNKLGHQFVAYLVYKHILPEILYKIGISPKTR